MDLVDWSRQGSKRTRIGLGRGRGKGLLGWTFKRTVVSWFNMATVLGWRGAKLLSGDGCLRACTMSWMPAWMMPVDEARGMGLAWGNQDKVSQIRSLFVLQTQQV